MNGDHRETSCRVVLLLAALLTLAACTGGSPGTPPPSTASGTTSASVPASPAPTAPVQEATPSSAVEFVKYFWALYNYAYATYDTKPLEAISDKKCDSCKKLIEDVHRIAADGTVIKGFELTVLEAVSPDIEVKTGTLVVASLQQQKGTAVAPDGSSTALPGFKSVRSTTALRWDGTWHIEALNTESKTSKPWPSE
ncbi:DUF6318 family protein [Spongisporangium articulatum]|uniref:DUF6318 family protein n=1 Tax=Spongisporangium articulatum TaxID=3362603 RepID=A0ABW8ATN3_9ACTN